MFKYTGNDLNCPYIEYVKARAKKNNKNYDDFFQIDGLPIYPSTLNRNIYLLGRPGCGKTAFISEFINYLIQKGEKAIIYGYKGDYLARFYDAINHYIFNSLDNRSIKYNLFDDLKSTNPLELEYQIMSVCKSIFPDSADPRDRFWVVGSRKVFKSMLHYLIKMNKKTNEDLKLFMLDKAADLIKKFETFDECTEAIKFIDPAGSDQAAGIIASIAKDTEFIRFLSTEEDLNKFSIRDWILDDRQEGIIFLENSPKFEDAIKGSLSLFIDQALVAILSREDYPKRNITVVIDELPTMPPLPSIKKYAQIDRSKGGVLVCASQDLAEIDTLYGENGRRTLLNSCSTHLYFAVNDSYTAEAMSKNIGEKEGIETSRTISDGTSISESLRTKPVILPSVFLDEMDNGHFYFKNPIFDNLFWQLDGKKIMTKYPPRVDSFVLREN